MALLMRPSALARARASLRNCRTECNLFRTRDVWVPNWEVCFSKLFNFEVFFRVRSIDLFLFRLLWGNNGTWPFLNLCVFLCCVLSRLFRCLIVVLKCRLATSSWMTRGFLRHPLLLHQLRLSCSAVFDNEYYIIEYMQQEQQHWCLHFHSSQKMFHAH